MFEFEIGQLIYMIVDGTDNDLRVGDEVNVIDREEQEEYCGSHTNYYQVQSTKTGTIDWVGEHHLKK